MTSGLLATGLSAILTNNAALRVTANNIANVNTPGYVRRVVSQETLAPAGQLAGVSLSEVRRATDRFFGREVISATGAFERYDVQADVMDQLNAALGSPGDGASLTSRLDALYGALGSAALDPALQANRQGVLYQLQSVAQTVQDLAAANVTLRQNLDREIGTAAASANDLMEQIYTINGQIQRAIIGGDTASGLVDQRDQMVTQLGEMIGIRTVEQPDGRLFVATEDGVSLVGDIYSRLSYQPSAGPAYYPLTVQPVNPKTGVAVGTGSSFDSHSSSGRLRGLIDMRDFHLSQIAEELGAFGQSLALSFNAQHNASSAVPPPSMLTGRETGLIDSDSLQFSGMTTIGIVNSGGALQHRIAIDFDAGTLSVDGGPTASIGSDIGSFYTALDTAMGAFGDASFANGVASLSATGGNGLVITNDATNPGVRGGLGFSHFFGLNDLFRSAGQSVVTTGLQAGDAGGFAPGGSFTLLLKGPRGERINETTVSVTGTTIGDMVNALNTAFSGNASFALDADGKLSMTPAASYNGYILEVTDDTTARGTTGQSFTELFGLGVGEAIGRAGGFRVVDEVVRSPARLAFAQSSLDATTALSTLVVGSGDNRGLLALQGMISRTISFSGAGALPARMTSLTDYASTFYQDVAARGSAMEASRLAQDTRLKQAQKNQSQTEGVNLDEELANMMTLQQAYNAGARLLRISDELFDELMNVI